MQSTDVKTKRSKRTKRIVISAVTVVLAVVTLLVSYGGALGVPCWNDVFACFGVYADLGDDLSVSFINVGSADAAYVTCHGKNILIDAGGKITSDKVTAYLKRNNCTHFDAIVASHPDSDHIGAMADVIENFGTDVLYMPQISEDITPQTIEYTDFNNSIKENNIKVITPQALNTVQIGDMTLQFISPQKAYSNTNDNSLVVRLVYKETSFLFTGDISQTAEKDIINSNTELKSDVLKVAHHGSKTSSSKDFLEKVSPQIAVVSVGANDSALPDYTTMAKINAVCNGLYRTDRDKTVVITSDGTNINVKTNA